MTDTTPIITLLTDFGQRGSYVGAMKGVILSITPSAQLVDITHEVNPQDIQQASLILSNVYPYFPAHTVHLVVVDPGVGSQRRPIAVETPRGRFVAPDNGVLTRILLQEPEWKAVALDNPDYWRAAPSHTFHGRDIFSPVAAHLAGGVPLAQLGSPVDDLVRFPLPPLELTSRSVRGRVVRVDHFGNVQTDIMRLRWRDEDTVELDPLDPALKDQAPVQFNAQNASVSFGWHELEGLYHTYSEVPAGSPLALISSSGELEISVNQGSAQDKLGIKVGDPVTLFFERRSRRR
ncbi:MAG: SAM-dependent chlorinase/fluorinase [Aggregatilineales bacterium]